MGLLATLAAQGLPDAWTDHMRAGPGCVRQRAITATAAAATTASAHLPAGHLRTEAFVAALYPATAGRPASPEELARWWRTIASARRGVLAWRFYISREYRAKYGEPAGEAPLPGNDHWTDLPAPWPERIGAFTRPDPALPLDDWTGFLRRLYREILHREATASELAAWPRELSPRQRERIAGEMLARGRRLARAPFDTLTCAELHLHH
jgi:hypothetical protein